MTALRSGSATDVGRVRSANEDRFLVADGIFAVADGLGGHQAGEVASKTAVETLAASFSEPSVDGVIEAAKAANKAVWQLAQEKPELQGMATTLTAVALVREDDEDRLAVINVGDSRAYLLQREELMQLTEDHSLVEQLVREGRLSAQEAAVHPQRSIITRALGLDPDVEIDVWQLLPYEGDRLLLCSDGLTNEVTDEDIAATLRRLKDPDDAARDLVQQARAHGGNDNITVVVVDVVDDDDRAERASEALAQEAAAEGSGSAAPAKTSRKTEANADEATRAKPAPTKTQDAEAEVEAVPAAAPDETPPARARLGSRLTWRVALFALGIGAVVGVAAGAVGWYARHTYFVGLEGQQIVIFKGRPGGILWFDPTVEQRTPLRTGDVRPARLDDLRAGHTEPSLADAQRYVANLRQEAATPEPAPVTSLPPPTSAPPAP